MTIKARNTIFIAGIIFAGTVFLSFVSGSLYTIYMQGIPSASPINTESAVINLSNSAALMVFALVSGIIILRSFRKTSSPEIFFLMVFLLSFFVESLRLVLIYISISGLPFENGMAVSRIIYFGRYLGVISLFLSGLFSCGIRTQRTEILFGLGAVISLTFAFSIPLDSRGTDFNLIFTNGLEHEFFIGFLIIKILGVWNFFYAGIINNNRNYYIIGLGTLLITAGRELALHFQLPACSSMGLILLVLGTVLFGIKMHKIYLWF